MTLAESYSSIKNSIVAFTPKYIPKKNKDDPKPPFPPIIGTGFIIHEDGVIATNDHVVKAFQKVFRPPEIARDDWGVVALLLKLIPAGMLEIPLEIAGAFLIEGFEPGKVYYGPEKPDVGLVHVKASGLPTLEIDANTIPHEGTELATAGFPMGTDALTAPGWLHQITPTLQRGIVSAVLPFICEKPHGFTINIMTQGGASGSPVFYPETSKVAGILYAGLNDIGMTRNKDIYKMPTNISYVVPSHYVDLFLKNIDNDPMLAESKKYPTLDEIIEKGEVVNRFEENMENKVREVKVTQEVSRNIKPFKLDED